VKIALVVGARPNFMKVGPIYFELKKHSRYTPLLIHTGQHYDKNLSEIFLRTTRISKTRCISWSGIRNSRGTNSKSNDRIRAIPLAGEAGSRSRCR